MKKRLKAPFPAFGGKGRVAALVWERIGDVDNAVEPFCNSAAWLLARPHPPRIETLNDLDCYVANFWRATQHDPEAVASYADGPVNEADLHARHRWLVLSEHAAEFRKRMRTDPDYYDARVAGWWCWGLCCWIGTGWCSTAELRDDGSPREKLPGTGGYTAGRGVHQDAIPDAPAAKDLQSKVRIAAHNKGSVGKGVHAGGGLGEQMPKLQGYASGCVPEAAGAHLTDAHRPQLADAYAAGRGVHAGPQSGDYERVKGLREKVPLLRGGRNAGEPGGQGVHAGPQGGGKRDAQLSLTEQAACGLSAEGGGQRPCLGDGRDSSLGRGVHGTGPGMAGTCAARRAWLLDWFGRLRDRLRCVRVCCGDWLRVCGSESVTVRLGTTGIFFDCPYRIHLSDGSQNRTAGIYSTDGNKCVVDDVIAYCVERGSHPQMRIAACCYEGEGYEVLAEHGWDVVAYKASGGYGNRSKKGKDNAARERVWFSPHCNREKSLFDALGVPDDA